MHNNIIKISVLLVFLALMSACGYKPSAKYVRDVVGESISTSIVISAHDPENTVLIKDAVDSAVIEVFHASLTTKEFSQTHLAIRLGNPTYTPLQYDKDGYVISYRANIVLKIKRYNDNKQKEYVTRGNYDFSIDANSVITDQQRFDAVKYSAAKAIRSFVAQVSAEGARDKE
jgi:hypothetical protein